MKTSKTINKNKSEGVIQDLVGVKVQSVRSQIRNGLRIEDFAYRLTSRKFWLTVFVCIYFMWRGVVGDPAPAFGSLTQVIVAFLAIQGGTDALAKLAEVRITRAASEPNYGQGGEIDPNVVTAAQNAQIGMQMGNITNQSIPPGD